MAAGVTTCSTPLSDWPGSRSSSTVVIQPAIRRLVGFTCSVGPSISPSITNRGLWSSPRTSPRRSPALDVYLIIGKRKQAFDIYTEARKIDPYFEPLWYWPSIGCFYFNDHEYEQALAHLGRTTLMVYWVEAYRAAAYAYLGNGSRHEHVPRKCSVWFLTFLRQRSPRRKALRTKKTKDTFAMAS